MQDRHKCSYQFVYPLLKNALAVGGQSELNAASSLSSLRRTVLARRLSAAIEWMPSEDAAALAATEPNTLRDLQDGYKIYAITRNTIETAIGTGDFRMSDKITSQATSALQFGIVTAVTAAGGATTIQEVRAVWKKAKPKLYGDIQAIVKAVLS